MLKRPRFSLLLPLSAFLSLAFCFVPAPTNVSVTCQNFKNVLYWNYTELNRQTVFNVIIQGYLSDHQQSVKTTQTYLDVTNYTQVIDAYLVSVEVLNGFEKSSAEQTQFSYNQDYISESKCVVDFPALNTSVLKNTIKVSFENPYEVFDPENLEDFSYTVSYNETESKYKCLWKLCTAEIPLHESLEGCIDLHFKGSIYDALTEMTKEVCGAGKESSKTDWIFLVTGVACALLVVLMLILAGAMICRNLTLPDSQSSIISKLLGVAYADHAVNVPEQPILSKVASVGHSPLLDSTELLVSIPTSPTDTDEEATHLPIHTIADLESEEQENGDMTEDEDSGSNCFSGYDRSKFTLDMGQGDVVDAYGPR